MFNIIKHINMNQHIVICSSQSESGQGSRRSDIIYETTSDAVWRGNLCMNKYNQNFRITKGDGLYYMNGQMYSMVGPGSIAIGYRERGVIAIATEHKGFAMRLEEGMRLIVGRPIGRGNQRWRDQSGVTIRGCQSQGDLWKFQLRWCDWRWAVRLDWEING